jgi:hypothetical protein
MDYGVHVNQRLASGLAHLDRSAEPVELADV